MPAGLDQLGEDAQVSTDGRAVLSLGRRDQLDRCRPTRGRGGVELLRLSQDSRALSDDRRGLGPEGVQKSELLRLSQDSTTRRAWGSCSSTRRRW
jgi:hypothetical protein